MCNIVHIEQCLADTETETVLISGGVLGVTQDTIRFIKANRLFWAANAQKKWLKYLKCEFS